MYQAQGSVLVTQSVQYTMNKEHSPYSQGT